MINRILISLALFGMSLTAMAQKRIFEYLKNNQVTTEMKAFRHLDFAVTASTSGIGFDFATPLGSWAQLRMGAIFRPYRTYGAQFNLQTDERIGEEAFTDERFEQMANLMKSFTNTYPDESVVMYGDAKMNNFKFLVDLYPIKKHRNFHVTVGLYWGNSQLIDAVVSQEFQKTLSAVNVFNGIYKKALNKESIVDISGLVSDAGAEVDGAVVFKSAIDRLRNWGRIKNGIVRKVDDGNGTISFYDANNNLVKTLNRYIDFMPDEYVENNRYISVGVCMGMGKYARDYYAPEDIYYDYSMELDNAYYVADASQPSGYREERYVRDENGREIKKGNLRYHKGEVVYKEGEIVRLVPDEDCQMSTKGNTNGFKPYIGVGYTLPISRDKKTCISVDAGVLIWGGHPSVNVQQSMGVNATGQSVLYNIDLTEDVIDVPKKVAGYVNTLKRYPVFPEIGIRLSHRLW